MATAQQERSVCTGSRPLLLRRGLAECPLRMNSRQFMGHESRTESLAGKMRARLDDPPRSWV